MKYRDRSLRNSDWKLKSGSGASLQTGGSRLCCEVSGALKLTPSQCLSSSVHDREKREFLVVVSPVEENLTLNQVQDMTAVEPLMAAWASLLLLSLTNAWTFTVNYIIYYLNLLCERLTVAAAWYLTAEFQFSSVALVFLPVIYVLE